MKRIFVGLVLFSLLFGMCVHYQSVHQQHSPYPEESQLVNNYEKYIGDEFYIWATIVETKPEAMYFTINSGTREIQIFVPERPAGVTEGDVVQVYGTIEPDHRISPTRLIVSSKTELRYLYTVSAIGAVVTALVGLRRWRINFPEVTIEPRDGDSDA